MDRVMTKELEDVHQSFQDMQKHQEEKNKALMEEIQLLKVVYYIIKLIAFMLIVDLLPPPVDRTLDGNYPCMMYGYDA